MSPWIFVITLANLGLIGVNGWLAWTRFRQTNWRFWLPRLSVPMIGFAASYGVFAYNQLFLPLWAAVVMAAAFESTYIGMASMDGLSDTERGLARTISASSAWISFAQNCLAGLFHAQPFVLAWLAIPKTAQFIAWGVLAMLHASQTWIAYHSAALAFHRVRPKSDAEAATDTDILVEVREISRDDLRPSSANKGRVASLLEGNAADTVEPPKEAAPRKRTTNGKGLPTNDPAALWAVLRKEGVTSFQAKSDLRQYGGWSSANSAVNATDNLIAAGYVEYDAEADVYRVLAEA